MIIITCSGAACRNRSLKAKNEANVKSRNQLYDTSMLSHDGSSKRKQTSKDLHEWYRMLTTVLMTTERTKSKFLQKYEISIGTTYAKLDSTTATLAYGSEKKAGKAAKTIAIEATTAVLANGSDMAMDTL